MFNKLGFGQGMDVCFIVLVGLTIASFVGSLSYRIPRKISIITPPSYCTSCKRKIKVYDLIPALSYLVLRGKCRYCRTKIPVKYFIVELGIPLIYVALYGYYGPVYSFFIYCYLMTVLIYLSLVDIERRGIGIFDVVAVYVSGILLVVLSIKGHSFGGFTQYLFGAVTGTALIVVSYLVILIIKKQLPLGLGDLLVIPGVMLHFETLEVIRILIFSSVTGVFIGIFLIITGRVQRSYRFPMMPFLAVGVLIEILLFSY